MNLEKGNNTNNNENIENTNLIKENIENIKKLKHPNLLDYIEIYYKENNNKLVYEIFNEVNFDFLCEFNNENINNGFIGIYNENLKICKFNKLTEKISENNSIKLRYTPKKILMNSNNYLIIIESDNHSM